MDRRQLLLLAAAAPFGRALAASGYPRRRYGWSRRMRRAAPWTFFRGSWPSHCAPDWANR